MAKKIDVQRAQTEFPFMEKIRVENSISRPKKGQTKRFQLSREEHAKFFRPGDD